MGTETTLLFMSTLLTSVTLSSTATCTPRALVTLRSWFRAHQYDQHKPTRQMQYFRNDSYIEPATCQTKDDDQAYLGLTKELAQDKSSNRICNPRVVCTFDRDRYPPVIYQVKCGTVTTTSDPFTCKRKETTIAVLRRYNCKDARGKDSEGWKWDDKQTIYTGCELLQSKCDFKH